MAFFVKFFDFIRNQNNFTVVMIFMKIFRNVTSLTPQPHQKYSYSNAINFILMFLVQLFKRNFTSCSIPTLFFSFDFGLTLICETCTD